MSCASKVDAKSVVMAWALIRTDRFKSCRSANWAEHRIAAAAPQVGGHAIKRVITPGHNAGESSTSCSLTTFLNKARGLLAAWRLALARILAKVLSLVPYCCICANPAPPK